MLLSLFVICMSVLVFAESKNPFAFQEELAEATLTNWLVESITSHLQDEHWNALKLGSKVHSAFLSNSSNLLSWRDWNVVTGERLNNVVEFRFWLEIYLTKLLNHLGRFHYSLQLLRGLEDELVKMMHRNGAGDEGEDLLNAWEFNCTYLARVYYYQGYTSLFANNREKASSRFMASVEACPCYTQSYLPFFQSRGGRMVNDFMEDKEAQIFRDYLGDLLKWTVYEDEEEEIVYRRNSSVICKFENNLIGRESLYELRRLASFAKRNIPILPSLHSPHPHWNLHQQYRLILASFHWSLFYYYDVANDTSNAWGHLLAAQRLEKFRLTESKLYNVSNSLHDVEIARQYYPSSYWPERREDWMGLRDEKRPIFIVGFFRTGSTLLESLLASSHARIWGLGEKKLLGTLLGEFQEELQTKNTREISSDRRKFFKLLSKLLKKTGSKYVEKLADEAKSLSVARSVLNDSYMFSGGFFNPSNTSFLPLGNILDDKPAVEAPIVRERRDIIEGTNVRLIDKMLGNYKNIPLIHLMFPNAIILHLVRDPLDTLLSCLKNQFSDASAYNIDFRTLVEEYISYLEIIAHYREVLPVMDYAGGRRRALVDIRYEELVANPNKVVQQLSELLELPLIYDSTQNKDNETSLDVLFPSSPQREMRPRSNSVAKTISFLQIQQPINSRSVGGWRKYSKEFSESIIPLLAPHLKRLGRQKALPYLQVKNNKEGKMNWALEEQFDYSKLLNSFLGTN